MAIKIGILSMQRIRNYGSFLQAYGLKRILEDLGCEVQFVDYHPGKTLIPTDEGTGLLRIIKKIKEILEQNGSIKNKLKYILFKRNFSHKYNSYLSLTDKKNYNPELDVLVIGSDEVFNCVQSNTNVGFSSELFGQNHNSKKTISYAASFGNTTLMQLDKYEVKDLIAKWISEFDAVSVRDKNSVEIVKSITEIEPSYNLDPVFIYDFKMEYLQTPKFVSHKRYLLLYGYSGRFSREECNEIRRYAKSKGLRILCLGGIQECCDRFIDANPFSVFDYFQNADYVVTDTYHGTIFSIITHSAFLSIVRDNSKGNKQKIEDLLVKFGLQDRLLTSITGILKIDRNIDYYRIDRIIQVEREKSINYLKRNIGL